MIKGSISKTTRNYISDLLTCWARNQGILEMPCIGKKLKTNSTINPLNKFHFDNFTSKQAFKRCFQLRCIFIYIKIKRCFLKKNVIGNFILLVPQSLNAVQATTSVTHSQRCHASTLCFFPGLYTVLICVNIVLIYKGGLRGSGGEKDKLSRQSRPKKRYDIL